MNRISPERDGFALRFLTNPAGVSLLALLVILTWFAALTMEGEITLAVDPENILESNSITGISRNDGGLSISFTNKDAYLSIPFDRKISNRRLLIEVAGPGGLRSIQLFYGINGLPYAEQRSLTKHATSFGRHQLEFELPDANYRSLRLDLNLKGKQTATTTLGDLRLIPVPWPQHPYTRYLLGFLLILCVLTVVIHLPKGRRVPILAGAAALLTGSVAIVFLAYLTAQKTSAASRTERLELAFTHTVALPKQMASSTADAVTRLWNSLFSNSRAVIPRLDLFIAPQHLQKLKEKRNEAIEREILITEEGDEVPAYLTLDGGGSVKVRARLKGDWTDHLENDRWSFRITINGQDAFLGMRRFSLQHYLTRHGHGEALLLRHLRKEGVLAPRYKMVDLAINNKRVGIMALEEHFSKELLESQRRRDSVILAYDEDYVWRERLANKLRGNQGKDLQRASVFSNYYRVPFRSFQENKVWKDDSLRTLYAEALGLMRGYAEGWIDADHVFDMDMYGKYYAILNLWDAGHGFIKHNMRFYYNPITRLFEPIGFDNDVSMLASALGTEVWHSNGFYRVTTSGKFVASYRNTLRRLKRELDSGQLAADIQGWEEPVLSALRTENSRIERFPRRRLQQRIEFLLENLPSVDPDKSKRRDNPAKDKDTFYPGDRRSVTPTFMHLFWINEGGRSYLEVQNLTNKPVTIHSLQFINGNTDKIEKVRGEFVIPPGGDAESRIKLAVKHNPEDKGGNYHVVATLNEINSKLRIDATRYFPATRVKDFLPADVESFVKDFSFIKRHGERHLMIPEGVWRIDKGMYVPDGFSLGIAPGTTLLFARGARLVVRSALVARGSKERRIRFLPQSDSWGGLVLLQATGESLLNNVDIEKVEFPERDRWGLTGALTSYESTLKIEDSRFADNHTEDTINIIRSTFSIDAVEIVESSSDAIDIDFGNGTISNSTFSGIDGDAIDVSGTDLIAHNNLISNTADKAVSIGEKSSFKGSNFTISDVTIAVACKDGSTGILDDSSIRRARRTAFAAYIKKPEYERPTLEVNTTTVEETDTESIVLAPAELVIDGTPRASLDINAKKILRAGYKIFGDDERISF